MKKIRIENILNIEKIENELELEQATSIFNKLRVLMKEDPSLKSLRKHLANLIEAYEANHWVDEEKITEEQILASENAEKIIWEQDILIHRRKELIKKALKENALIQNDLAEILDHRKNYMSELINGVRPFSQEDIFIINQVLDIDLNDLIIPIVKEESIKRISQTLQKLNRPNLKAKVDISEKWKSNLFEYIWDKVKESGLQQINSNYERAFSVFSERKQGLNLFSISK